MRRVLITGLTFLSLGRLDRQEARECLRRLAIRLCELALRLTSRPYRPCAGPAVVFAPHPDDETFGCGTLIARKRSEGLPVHVIFITDGSASHPGHPLVTPAGISAIRHQEARTAMAVLGVESVAIHFLDEPDGTLGQLSTGRRETLVARIAALLNVLQPTEIFLPCRPDGSTEHDAVFDFVVEAVHRLGTRTVLWQYPVWSWWNPVLLVKHVIGRAECRRAPAENFRVLKRQALAHYRSQLEPLPPQTVAALPAGLVRTLTSDMEYFFRFNLPAGKSGPAVGPGRAAL